MLSEKTRHMEISGVPRRSRYSEVSRHSESPCYLGTTPYMKISKGYRGAPEIRKDHDILEILGFYMILHVFYMILHVFYMILHCFNMILYGF